MNFLVGSWNGGATTTTGKRLAEVKLGKELHGRGTARKRRLVIRTTGPLMSWELRMAMVRVCQQRVRGGYKPSAPSVQDHDDVASSRRLGCQSCSSSAGQASRRLQLDPQIRCLETEAIRGRMRDAPINLALARSAASRCHGEALTRSDRIDHGPRTRTAEQRLDPERIGPPRVQIREPLEDQRSSLLTDVVED